MLLLLLCYIIMLRLCSGLWAGAGLESCGKRLVSLNQGLSDHSKVHPETFTSNKWFFLIESLSGIGNEIYRISIFKYVILTKCPGIGEILLIAWDYKHQWLVHNDNKFLTCFHLFFMDQSPIIFFRFRSLLFCHVILVKPVWESLGKEV